MTAQLALDIPADPPPASPTALRVNEVNVFLYAPRDAANGWALYRMVQPDARFTIVESALPGDIVDVACDSRADAEWLRDTLLDLGIPKAALKLIGGAR